MNTIILALSVALVVWTLLTAQKSLKQLQAFTLLQRHTNEELEYLHLNDLPNRLLDRVKSFDSDAVIRHGDLVLACIVRDTKTYIVMLPRKEV